MVIILYQAGSQNIAKKAAADLRKEIRPFPWSELGGDQSNAVWDFGCDDESEDRT
jgi:hypothetical protein